MHSLSTPLLLPPPIHIRCPKRPQSQTIHYRFPKALLIYLKCKIYLERFPVPLSPPPHTLRPYHKACFETMRGPFLSPSPMLTSGRGVSTANTSSATSTTAIKGIMPYDSKVDKDRGSHEMLSDFSPCAPPNSTFAFSSSTSSEMSRLRSPMLAASVDRPQQHQQAHQQQDRAASVATTPGEVFSHHPPSLLPASVQSNDFTYHFGQLQHFPLLFPSSTCFSSAAQPLPPTSKGLLWTRKIGQSQPAFATHMKGTNEAAAPLRHYKKIKISCLHHAGAAVATTATLPLATVSSVSRTRNAAKPTGLAILAGALATSNVREVSGRKGKERNEEAVWTERTMTYESFHHQASALPNKRRAPRMDLSKLTAEEQERWIKARARQYSASARQRQSDRMQDLRDQLEISRVFQVLVDAAPDAVLLLSPDERARILFANDQCGHLLRLDYSNPEGQALVGRSLWEWMNAHDKAAVVAAIGVCLLCKDATRREHCTFHNPTSSFALQPRVVMQQQAHQGPQHYHQQWQRQQEIIRADLTFCSSERGVIVFMRPDKTGGKGILDT